MIKKLIVLAVSLCMAFIYTGCSSGSINTFTLGMENMPSNFDPQSATGSDNLNVIENIFDGLFENNGGKIENVLAESYTVSADGTKYTIKLKNSETARGSQFHSRYNKEFDGKPVTAHDFAFALQRVLDPKTRSPYAETFRIIKNADAVLKGENPAILGVKADDDYTLTITLEKADSTFIEKLCSPALYPCNKEFFESTGGAYGLSIKNILSNGPFRLNYIDEENATIIRVDGVTGGVDRLRLVTVEPDRMAESYKNSGISCYFAYTNEFLEHSSTNETVFDSSVLSIVFNTESRSLSNENMRKALAWYAYGFINSGANMVAVKSAGSIFPGITTLHGEKLNDLYTTSLPVYMSQDSKALYRQALSELEISKADGLTVLIPSDNMYSIIFENINQLWQRDLNIYCKIEYLPSQQIKQRVADKKYDIAFMPYIPTNDTPLGILENFTSVDNEIKDIVDNLKTGVDVRDIEQVISAEKIILNRAYCAPMGNDVTVFYCRNDFSNVQVNYFTNVVNIKSAKIA